MSLSDYKYGYNTRRIYLIEYLRVKTQECDWHAVSDAANDLRVLEAKGPREVEPCDLKIGPPYICGSPSHDPFKEAGWASNPIQFGPCGWVSEGTGWPCVLPAKHIGDHVYEKGIRFPTTCCKCGKVVDLSQPVNGIFYCGYGCT